MKTMERPNTEPMPLSGDKDLNGVPLEIVEMRDAQRKAREAERAETNKILKENTGEKNIVTPDKRNIR